ncbi:protease complex subunit PrcB family protein [Azospirillum sp. B21]|uniref:protease complex subunit PrcB family protein n=1 Tax=Azospirillum sp. B21 TaxID=2607496 RepID=UPI0011F03626|nr:protease complex subunit PrcB family protein [Azospirillum sp. B21]KAA0580425.1 protease complex subunit PrcB family protein [Azospirillum sp. B21]
MKLPSRLRLIPLVLAPALVLTACQSGTDRAGGNLLPAQAEAGTVWQGNHSSAAERAYVVARDGAEWTALWARVGEPAPTSLPGGRMAVAVFLGPRDTAGYGVTIDSVQQKGADLVVGYRETVPGPAQAVAQMRTSPYAVRLLPSAAGTPKFVRGK